MLQNWQSGMWLHFGGTLTLKSDDGRGAGAGGRYMSACTRGQDGGGGYMWARITGGRTVRVGKNCAIAPLLILLLVGNV